MKSIPFLVLLTGCISISSIRKHECVSTATVFEEHKIYTCESDQSLIIGTVYDPSFDGKVVLICKCNNLERTHG